MALHEQEQRHKLLEAIEEAKRKKEQAEEAARQAAAQAEQARLETERLEAEAEALRCQALAPVVFTPAASASTPDPHAAQ
ncbi:hypothetical protein, partial [Bradyrhizobium sp. TM233]|uniref:hypothetical protein n=1 Tax=Bradyrhizobium sp. TM233 TaxID=2599801 RepID=UPI0030C67C1B